MQKTRSNVFQHFDAGKDHQQHHRLMYVFLCCAPSPSSYKIHNNNFEILHVWITYYNLRFPIHVHNDER